MGNDARQQAIDSLERQLQYSILSDSSVIFVRAGEKLGQERRESGGPWRSKNRPPEICLRKRSQEERFVGYRRDVHSGAICTRSARGLC